MVILPCLPSTTVNVIARKGDRELTASLRSEMSFSEYDAFQQNIYDTPPLPDRSAWIVVEGAQMRTGNGTNDKLIRRLPEGTQVEILQEGDPWVKVKVDDREGYVKRCYITYTKGSWNLSRKAGMWAARYIYTKSPAPSPPAYTRWPGIAPLRWWQS